MRCLFAYFNKEVASLDGADSGLFTVPCSSPSVVTRSWTR